MKLLAVECQKYRFNFQCKLSPTIMSTNASKQIEKMESEQVRPVLELSSSHSPQDGQVDSKSLAGVKEGNGKRSCVKEEGEDASDEEENFLQNIEDAEDKKSRTMEQPHDASDAPRLLQNALKKGDVRVDDSEEEKKDEEKRSNDEDGVKEEKQDHVHQRVSFLELRLSSFKSLY